MIAIIPPVAIAALIVLLVMMIRTAKQQKKYLIRIEKEIQENGNTAEWWNENNKAYRNYMNAHGGYVTQSQKSSPTKENKNVGGNTAGKVVADVAASYAMGSAARKVIDNTPPVSNLKRNPSTTADRGRRAQETAKANQAARRNQGKQSKERISSGGKTYFISTMPNGNQTLTDARGKRVGLFDSTRNITTDGNGRKIGKGNLLKTLI